MDALGPAAARVEDRTSGLEVGGRSRGAHRVPVTTSLGLVGQIAEATAFGMDSEILCHDGNWRERQWRRVQACSRHGKQGQGREWQRQWVSGQIRGGPEEVSTRATRESGHDAAGDDESGQRKSGRTAAEGWVGADENLQIWGDDMGND